MKKYLHRTHRKPFVSFDNEIYELLLNSLLNELFFKKWGSFQLPYDVRFSSLSRDYDWYFFFTRMYSFSNLVPIFGDTNLVTMYHSRNTSNSNFKFFYSFSSRFEPSSNQVSYQVSFFRVYSWTFVTFIHLASLVCLNCHLLSSDFLLNDSQEN